MKKTIEALLIGAFCLCTTVPVRADLLGVNPSFPVINFVNTDAGAVSYDPSSQMFSVDALPYNIFLSEQDLGSIITSNRSIQIQLDTDGSLLSGTNGFSLSGQFTEVSNGITNTYAGLLLQGDVVAFGSAGGTVSQYDFRV